MTTLVLEFPDRLAEQIQTQGIPPEQLKSAIVHFVELYLREYSSGHPPNYKWTSGTEFANRIIANNRDLFKELADL